MYLYLAAGNAFCQAAKLHMQMQNKLDSATSFVDAGNAYKKADPQGNTTSCVLYSIGQFNQKKCECILVCACCRPTQKN